MGVVDQRADDALLGGDQRFEADRRCGYEEEHGDHEPWRGLYQLREPGVEPRYPLQQRPRKEAAKAPASERDVGADGGDGGVLIQPSVVAAEDGEHRQKADEAEQQQRGEGSFLRVGRVAVGFPEGEEEVAEEVVDQKHHQEPHGDDEPGGVAVAEVVVEVVEEGLAGLPAECADCVERAVFHPLHAGEGMPAGDDGVDLLAGAAESRHEREEAHEQQRAADAPDARLFPGEEQEHGHGRAPEEEGFVEEDAEREEEYGAEDAAGRGTRCAQQHVDGDQQGEEHEVFADDLGERAEE